MTLDSMVSLTFAASSRLEVCISKACVTVTSTVLFFSFEAPAAFCRSASEVMSCRTFSTWAVSSLAVTFTSLIMPRTPVTVAEPLALTSSATVLLGVAARTDTPMPTTIAAVRTALITFFIMKISFHFKPHPPRCCFLSQMLFNIYIILQQAPKTASEPLSGWKLRSDRTR